MKMKIIFEESSDALNKGWSSTFTCDGVEQAEDALYAFGRATKEIFNWDGLEARQDFYSQVHGRQMTNKFNAEF